MGDLPSGLVTFVFTDIEGSTQLFRRIGDRFSDVLDRHREIIRAALTLHRGAEVKTEGDGFFLAFGSPTDAVRFSVAAQRALAREPWPSDAEIRVRIGMHSGLAEPVDDDYVALPVHQAARVSAAGHGGQVLLTTDTLDAAQLDQGISAVRLGAFQLKDFDEPVPLFEVSASGMPSEFPALRAIPAAAHNVPVVLSSFVGRESELEDLASVVAAHRVVTVAGVGGVGKTRLTFELASRNAGDFDDGTWVVLLAAVDEPDAVVGRVAQVVGVREEAGQPLIDSVVSHLASRRLLLVLDNCEHVVETVALLVDRLVSECPRVTVLATSREPLRLAGEHVWRLPPLELPDVVPTDLGELIRIDAVRLLTDRAQSSDPRFTLTMSTAAAVIDICRQLDGIPLAIELVAARLRHLTVEQVAERLSNRLHLLTGGGRDLLPRQRTLRATIEWSHELLTEPERVLFRRLAVFRSRFSLAATEEVCSDESLPVDDVLDALADLVDRSLVSLADDSDGLRYRLLVILRDYALEMLDAAGETTTFRQRHLEQIRTEPAVHDFAYNAGPALTAAQVEMMRILQDDLRSARDWALEVDDADAVFELTTAWSNYVFLTARYRAGRPWCDRALALTGGSAELRGRILHLAGVLAVCDGDSRAAYDLATRALEHAERHDLPALAFRAHCLVADAAIDEGMLIDAREHLLAAREVGAPTPVAAAIVTRSLGDIAGSLGDPVTQEGAYREAATEALQLGEDFEAARSLVMLGWLLAPRDAAEAVAALREAWQRADGVGAAGAVTVAATGLAACAAHRGQHIEAVEFLGATESLAERLGTSVAAALNDYHHPAKAYDVCATMLRKVLPDKAFDEAWQRGRSTDAVELRDALFAGVDISR